MRSPLRYYHDMSPGDREERIAQHHLAGTVQYEHVLGVVPVVVLRHTARYANEE